MIPIPKADSLTEMFSLKGKVVIVTGKSFPTSQTTIRLT